MALNQVKAVAVYFYTGLYLYICPTQLFIGAVIQTEYPERKTSK